MTLITFSLNFIHKRLPMDDPSAPSSSDHFLTQPTSAESAITDSKPSLANSTDGFVKKLSISPSIHVPKDSPLTDIATSPPAFDLTLDGGVERDAFRTKSNGHMKDNYESSELSDLGDDDSEAETDKMDFLDDDHTNDDKVSDLQALSTLTELARLKEVDSDDSDMDINKSSTEFQTPLHGESGDEEIVPYTDTILPDNLDDIEEGAVPQLDGKLEDERSESALSTNPKENKEAEEEIEKDINEIKNEVAGSTDALTSTSDIPKVVKRILEDEDDEIEKERIEKKAKLDEDDEPHVEEGDNEKVEEVEKVPGVEEELPEVEDNEGQEDVEKEKEDEVDKEEADEEEADEEEADEVEDVEKPIAINSPNSSVKVEEDLADEEEIEEDDEDHELEDDVDLDEQRKLAIKELISIESSFAQLRDKLYQDKLSLLEHELQLCLEGSHPELSKIYFKINEYYQDNLKLSNATLNYNLKCINTETIATRTSIHQDFLKQLMDSKNDMITETTSLWYKINKERNQMDQLAPDYNFTAIPLVPTIAPPLEEPQAPEQIPLSKKAIKQNTLVELVQHRNNYNHQLGVLNGLLEFHGFPSAVSLGLIDESSESPTQELLLRKASEEEVCEDFKAMGIPI